MKAKLLAAVVSGPVLAAGCSAASTDRPAITPGEHSKTRFSLIAASADGAIVLDTEGDTLRGFARSGVEIWTDHQALQIGADAACLATDAVFSAVGDSTRLNPDSGRSPAGGVPRWPFRPRRSAVC
jgi:hypothetical protein